MRTYTPLVAPEVQGAAANESIKVLTERLRKRLPFFFFKYGDGALECIYHQDRHHTCDHELYTPELAQALLQAWNVSVDKPNVYVGDWATASFSEEDAYTLYEAEWRRLVDGRKVNWLHFECTLPMPYRPEEPLLAFYQALHDYPGSKVMIGPESMLRAASTYLHCHRGVGIPMAEDLLHILPYVEDKVRELGPFDVLLYAAGMAGNVLVTKLWQERPERTYISLGSSLDPLCRGKTRGQQYTPRQAKMFFARLNANA